MARTKLLLFLTLLASLGLFSHEVAGNWKWRARISLLVKGYGACHFGPPNGRNRVLAGHENEFMAAVVLKNGVAVGCIDPYGQFVGKLDAGPDYVKEGIVTAILIGFQIISFLGILGAAAWMLWQSSHADLARHSNDA